ncbi:tRNA 2-selenouridine(34) synthase MnmH [Trichlorobacter ammonificans]|uniref:Selenophosphate-dependent tRNA 2-selenouridine synthase n=1 Tax=Trichlorobacter ammonificans TaxID=2916410 RepID=A0ABM9DA40_9BACT|nr:tRNA 2-selenouridine(34) synthase MnmH [Trichlorobacter ammonificans]CAH2032089.1 Selenophosphate-dependent tRNA 2-selenouridine synthase [Trichlorobacter ammonificans]
MPRSVPFSPDLLASHCIIDARTPLEFAEDHLPGACNVPILTNAERVEIGTLYKQQGPQIARERGLQLTCHRFPAIVATIAELAAGRPALVYCWRGGLRSESVALLLEMAGYPAVKLSGGYKAFRGAVNACFENFQPPAPLVVLHGMTGSGKTEFLLRLAASGWSTVDLEGLARHRGSAFGSLGLGAQPSQKRFETLLWQAFQRCTPGRPIVLEGESKRIGRLTLPGNLYDVMAASCKVWCDVSVETRIGRLAAEYARKEYRRPMADALERIRKKLDGTGYAALRQALDAWDVRELAHGLVEQYYDRLYYRVRRWEPAATISLEEYDAAERQLDELCRRL